MAITTDVVALLVTLTSLLIAVYHYRKLMVVTTRAKEMRKEANSNTALVARVMGGTRTTTTSGGIDGGRRYSMEFSYRSLEDLQAADAAWTQLSTNLTGLLRLATAKTGNDTYTYATDQLETLDHD